MIWASRARCSAGPVRSLIGNSKIINAPSMRSMRVGTSITCQYGISVNGFRQMSGNSRLEEQRAARGLSHLGSSSQAAATTADVKVANHTTPPFTNTFNSTPNIDGNMFSDKVTVVDTLEKAQAVLKVLESHSEHIWACDTEVADIDVKTQGPVGNGFVTCVSIFGGPDVDFGLGDGPGTSVWIDNLDEAEGLLMLFKDWFENSKYKKCWHNYGFDRHVMNNMGINCKGFYADTFHMARLWDSSRDKITGGGPGYGLEALSNELVHDERLAKVGMKELFGVAKPRKDGTLGKIKELPSINDLQMNTKTRSKWIEYSAKDAIATWWVRHELEKRLLRQDWVISTKRIGNMFEFYNSYISPFGELLTDIESTGIKVDKDGHLKKAELLAKKDKKRMENIFIEWAGKFCVDAKYMNISSSTQIGAFLFGHYEKKKLIAKDRVFRIDKDENEYKMEVVFALLIHFNFLNKQMLQELV